MYLCFVVPGRLIPKHTVRHEFPLISTVIERIPLGGIAIQRARRFPNHCVQFFQGRVEVDLLGIRGLLCTHKICPHGLDMRHDIGLATEVPVATSAAHIRRGLGCPYIK
ncbi:hypothetical protein PsorP6_007978 [Peronosclerospora sorghi]|uniref:Uncharacterized protein n=1 Tax=Peronosclerospora sorghi TaxID=230839 RepID=A0ACC0WAI1_9STRA|nr:hypothetical protein PsorP6_007978 [Peronosclerospora sorghi]